LSVNTNTSTLLILCLYNIKCREHKNQSRPQHPSQTQKTKVQTTLMPISRVWRMSLTDFSSPTNNETMFSKIRTGTKFKTQLLAGLCRREFSMANQKISNLFSRIKPESTSFWEKARLLSKVIKTVWSSD
jgi:hypothetical protein